LRLDKFLFFTRLTKTRALAQSIAAHGHIRIDGQPVQRAHASVSPGQVITLPLHDRIRIIRIEALPSRRGPACEAQLCYSEIPIDGHS
jgi:ribosome-associated heat shock protein Hsp15